MAPVVEPAQPPRSRVRTAVALLLISRAVNSVPAAPAAKRTALPAVKLVPLEAVTDGVASASALTVAAEPGPS